MAKLNKIIIDGKEYPVEDDKDPQLDMKDFSDTLRLQQVVMNMDGQQITMYMDYENFKKLERLQNG